MEQKLSAVSKSSLLAGCVAGLLSFLALTAFAQYASSVTDVRLNPTAFYGRTVTLSGIAGPIQADSQQTRYRFRLYEEGTGPTGHGPHSIWVSVPGSSFMYRPEEGQRITVSNVVLEEPYEIGRVEAR
jgi:hypothetical protein